MRPVNLIPAEDRRGENAPLRTGPFAYVVVGALVLVLAGVTALVLTGNQVADRKAEVERLEGEVAAASARAQRLAAYTQFQLIRAQRVATVTSLADSRFDWERVMRELSLVLPDDVWLVSLDASASPGAGEGGSSSTLRGSAAGPALEISGCAAGQEGVARFVTVLKDIDGVTRVGVQSSELADQNSGAGVSAGGEAGGGEGGEDCRTRDFIAKFEIVAAFDAAPVPIASDSAAAVAPAPVTDTSTETSTEAGE